MRAVLFKRPGPPEVLYLGEAPDLTPGPHELLVRVHASALNRADILQRQGKYPAPAEDSPILGLEMAGEVVAAGTEVTKRKVGEQICGLVNGGGYAEYALIDESVALPLPPGVDLLAAAGIPEVYLTAYQSLHWIAGLQAGETVLIHAGASGVGTAAIQLVRAREATALVTASAAKHELCYQLGAALAIDYRTEDFADRVLEHTQDRGVDIILDVVAADYFHRNIRALALDGRMVLLALLGGNQVDNVRLATIIAKRLQITGSTLRNRSMEYKRNLSQALYTDCWPLFADGRLRPVIDRVFPWTEVAEAHRYMESNQNQGKIILQIERG